MTEHYIDCIGDFCPAPLIRVQEKLKELRSGDFIVLETDHSCAAINIINDMKKRGIKAKAKEIDNGIWRVIIKQ
ncbi:MAG: tRNA 2-thiouridine synthesizing protein [Thermoanaerobacteraceae bacterium]|uniref:sulfurtransferase TusA family protein n=1 Tax=Biomaibacter acetigenes TaxID=2316383 RepID=UPI0013CE7570|nr:sulfurtransferase TusA family protein [Biomaibacter acetigenes]MDK2879545.1 tRNA 2-thiouridine synthesizing protein [Thermoanaerobacteraceae bacterium]MDN5302596.1 tRNA 2-thiouridine synthesizing protein [Thermoanaerobacteraceae bacterium]MDN5311507.1 tRNA 2-thiouridine synthesizing protein [Thermoanaerobacteraceae bacterium]